MQHLEQIEPADLSADAQINRDMLLRQLRDNLTEYEEDLYLIAFDMRSGPLHRPSMIDTLPMESAQDHADWLNRLRGLPGLALAYKIYQMKTLELRGEVEKAPGENLDIMVFHDHMLGAGALPLDIL